MDLQTQQPRKLALGNESGFSLLEIIIVLGIIGGLIAVLIGSIGSSSESARKKETSVRASQVQSNLLRYQADMGRMPSQQEGLKGLWDNPGSPKWSGPYGAEEDAKDAWGQPFDYQVTGKGPQLVSPGPDGQPGNEDDLTYQNGRLLETSNGAGAPAAE